MFQPGQELCQSLGLGPLPARVRSPDQRLHVNRGACFFFLNGSCIVGVQVRL